MLNLFKKKYERSRDYYTKEIMPLIRDAWADKEFMHILGIEDLFAEKVEIKKDLSREILVDAYYRVLKMEHLLIDAYDSDYITEYFKNNPDKFKHFGQPTLFQKVDKSYVVALLKKMYQKDCESTYKQLSYEEDC